MANKEALDYILECLRQKIEPQVIRAHLKSTGYSEEIVEEAFKEAEKQTPVSPAPKLAPSLEARLVADGLPGFSNLFSFAWHELFSRPRVYFGIQLIPIALSILLSFLNNPLRGSDGRITADLFTRATAVPLPLMVLLALLAILVGILNFLAPLALLYAKRDSLHIFAAYKRALGRAGSYLWAVGLMGLIVGGGFLFFIVPGILFSLWFSLVLYVFTMEDIRGLKALHKSQAYVRGHTFEVFIRLFELGVVCAVAVWGLIIGFSLFFPPFRGDVLLGGNILSANVLWYLLSLVASPLWVFYVLGIYKKLAFLNPGAGVDYPKGTRSYWVIALLGFAVFLAVFLGGVTLVTRLITQ